MRLGRVLSAALLAAACTAQPAPLVSPSHTATPSAATVAPSPSPTPTASPTATPVFGGLSAADPLASVWCSNFDVDTCLEIVRTAAAIADPPFVPGTAHVVLYASDVWFACFCPRPVLVVEVSPNWKSYSALRAWIGSVPQEEDRPLEVFDPSRLGDRVTRLPRGGPWAGNFIAGKLRVTFTPGTSPADGSEFAEAFGISARRWTESATNRTEFDLPAGIEMSELAEVADDARVCSADLYRFNDDFQLLPSAEPDECVSDLGLHVNGRAKVTGGPVTLRAEPKPDSKALKPRLPKDRVVYVIDGPTTVDGVDWWQVLPLADYNEDLRLGWLPALRIDLSPTLTPAQPLCPSLGNQLTPRTLTVIGPLDALACFGGSDIAFEAVVDCSAAIVDSSVGGADWIASDCHADHDLPVAISASLAKAMFGDRFIHEFVSGVFQVRAHFHDPQADNCFYDPVNAPEIPSVVACRQLFVLTAFEPVQR
jgi:hypothetical protein